MNADALPPDIDPKSRCRLSLPNRDDLDEAGQQTFDLLSDPHGGSLAGLRGPGGLRLHSPRVSAGLRPVNTYLRYAAALSRASGSWSFSSPYASITASLPGRRTRTKHGAKACPPRSSTSSATGAPRTGLLKLRPH